MYYQLNIDYIIETYCVNKAKPELQCNGKCHLAKQLQLADNTDDDNNPNPVLNVVYEAFYPLYFQERINTTISSYVLELKQHRWFYNSMIKFQLSYDSFEPPEVA